MTSKNFILTTQEAKGRLSTIIQRGTRCYYLHDDYALLADLRQRMPNKCYIKLLEGRFQKVFAAAQDEFLNFTHELSNRQNTRVWWGTHLASKSSTSIPLFKILTYLLCARKIIQVTEEPIIWIVGSKALGRSLHRLLKTQRESQEVSVLGNIQSWRLVQLIKYVAKTLLYFSETFIFVVCARLRQLPNLNVLKKGKNPIIFRSWVTRGAFNQQGIYQDRNFGSLIDCLASNGHNIWIVPMFFNMGYGDILDCYKRMKESGHQFLVPECCLSFGDYIRTWVDGVQQIRTKFNHLVFQSIDVTEIVKEVHLRSCLQPELLRLNAIEYLIKRMASKQISVKKFIYPMENNTPEKPFILAVRRFFPKVPIVGFQHTVWYEGQLSGFLAPREAQIHPLPDLIICSGKKYINILQRCGFPRKRMKLGPNLRYTNVQSLTHSEKGVRGKETKNILIILSFDHQEPLEIFDKLRMVLTAKENCRVWIKYHPLSRVSSMESFLRKINFPPIFEWVEGRVSDWVSKSDVVIAVGGSVAILEAICQGVPVIRLAPSNNVYLNPVWSDYPIPIIDDNETLLKWLQHIFTLTPTQQAEFLQLGSKMREDYFEPISADNMTVFV